MIDSYFFVPGDKPKYLSKIKEFNADFFVIDLEDSVSNYNKILAMENVLEMDISENIFLRIPFNDNCYTNEQLITLINKFNGRIVIPKFSTIEEISKVILLSDFIFDFKLIILIENPLGFINLNDILKQYSKHIFAIGFGSHDFSSIMGMKHNHNQLEFYKKKLILLAKAYGKKYIDGVDLNIRDLSVFEEECIYAFEAGADGKFIIHPSQLLKMKSIKYFSEIEIEKLKEIYSKMELYRKENVDVLEIDGVVYEKPHLMKIERLIQKLNNK